MQYRTSIRTLLLAIGLACSAAPLSSRAAAPAGAAFSIAAQPLGQALNELARQAGLVLLADARLTEGRQSPALNGKYSVNDALHKLLAGSGLRADIRSDGSVVLTREPQAAAGAVRIGTLRVQGQGGGLWSDDEDGDPADLPYTQSASSVYIPQEQIERFRGTSPADIFKGTPGVQSGDSRNSGAVDVNIRGMQGQGRVPVLIDGSLQSTTVYRGYSGIGDRSYIDPDLISSIRIDKGPSLSAQGAGAIGGLVSMQTLLPEDILAPGQRSGFRLRGGIQSNSKAAPSDFSAAPRTGRNGLLDSSSAFGSIAYAVSEDDYDLVAAYSQRSIGNYFAGKKGHQGYQLIQKYGGDSGVTRFFKAGEEVLNTANATTSVLLKGALRLPGNHKVELGYRYFDSTYGEVMPSQIYRNSSGVLRQWKPSQVRTDAWTARYGWKPAGQPLIDLKANLWLTDMQSAARNGDVFRNPLEGKTRPSVHDCESCIDPLYLAKNQSQRTGADISNTSRFDSGYGTLKISYGLSAQRENIGPSDKVRILQDDINQNRVLRDGKRNEESAFVAVQWAPRGWLTIDAGGRYQRYRTRDRNRMAEQQYDPRGWARIYLYGKDRRSLGTAKWPQDEQGNFTPAGNPALSGVGMLENYGVEPTPVDMSKVGSWSRPGFIYHDPIPGAFTYSVPMERKGSGFAPSFGVTARLSDSVSVYLREVQGMRMPSLYESTLGFSATYFSPLKPERSKNRELGLNLIRDGVWTAGDKARLKIAYFDNTTRDYITRRQIPGLAEWASNFSMANTDKYSVSGVELQSSYDRGDFFGDLSATLNRKTELCDAANAAYLRTKGSILPRMKDTPDCSPIGFSSSYVSNHIQPKMSMNWTLGARLLAQRLTTGARFTYVGAPIATEDKDAQWQTVSGTSPQILTRPYTLIDLFASYKITPNATLNLALDNLSDRYYLDPLTLSLMPGPGRTARLSLGMKF